MYKTQQSHCECCGHKLDEPKTIEEKVFYFTKNDCLEWLELEDLKFTAEEDEELNRIVNEFVYETISFHATSLNTHLIIEQSEIDKVKQFVLNEVVA